MSDAPIVLFNRRFVLGISLQRPRSWREDAYNIAEFDAWDRACRKQLGWRAGLRFFRKSNTERSWVLASRHWPHLLCWSWSLWGGFRRSAYWDGPRRLGLVVSRKYRFVEIDFLGPYLRLTWQDYGHMPACGAPRTSAPKILWQHHLRDADVEGSA